jgi:hypothetical protein
MLQGQHGNRGKKEKKNVAPNLKQSIWLFNFKSNKVVTWRVDVNCGKGDMEIEEEREKKIKKVSNCQTFEN